MSVWIRVYLCAWVCAFVLKMLFEEQKKIKKFPLKACGIRMTNNFETFCPFDIVFFVSLHPNFIHWRKGYKGTTTSYRCFPMLYLILHCSNEMKCSERKSECTCVYFLQMAAICVTSIVIWYFPYIYMFYCALYSLTHSLAAWLTFRCRCDIAVRSYQCMCVRVPVSVVYAYVCAWMCTYVSVHVYVCYWTLNFKQWINRQSKKHSRRYMPQRLYFISQSRLLFSSFFSLSTLKCAHKLQSSDTENELDFNAKCCKCSWSICN